MKPLIEIRDLLIQRNGLKTLYINSLDIEQGETLAIIGPNGAGKSTFLLALAHLLKPAGGCISFASKPLSTWNDLEYRRTISFVFQDPLLMDMSVADNVALGLKFRGVAKDEIRARVDKWLKLLGIGLLEKRCAGQLSGGEAQRVSLARAFVLDPQLLLMDEPFSSLDPSARTKLLDDLSGLLAEDHRTTIFVTHNFKEAAQLGDRVAVIINGELKQVGTSQQVKAESADQSMVDFLKEF
jgi:tungstate transport system ATP-binding protein